MKARDRTGKGLWGEGGDWESIWNQEYNFSTYGCIEAQGVISWYDAFSRPF